ncbi:hypothetical protein BU24DRAFT_489619 [Aaosphaeria arxii CBS 175.79]|uniref:G-protein coupled receptors family 2 profile 2 domain-containing protein n=1 Tax=Aaosphaeria arxii CBS 175.79 TaxID=1450172 RepID=A0A6A5Y5A2_9PLEO|nr:uncharacterized protein BU24DRAFT_489619 [Aaosphaeria arxii CBS 175.79]KAF2019714.1 hypothetical protein BU24DRAFT_489619 [Aaosphaeria arxii CBS 175.79]
MEEASSVLPALVNATDACPEPLLDQSLFGVKRGYQAGRYCGLGALSDGNTCCLPCPIQDWVYHSEWKQQLRISNYLSILSVALCVFLLLSFAVLPASATRRHYLSVGLLFPVLSISLSFVIPIGSNPDLCYDAITPNDMNSSASCAWTGALVTLGGLASVIWVFLRSLWLHVRVVWDVAPGRGFKWASIAAGTLLPLGFLVAILVRTGFSYRMGRTCLPNHEDAIVTFWAWLMAFAVAAFVLQFVTTGYCVMVYLRTLRRERSRARSTFERGGRERLDTWREVKKMLVLQWRNILVSIFVLVGSVAFFVVFWAQDSKLGRVDNEEDLVAVKTWIECQMASRGDKAQCRKYVEGLTVPFASVLTALILASLVGVEIFILLFRLSMLKAWITLFRSLPRRLRNIYASIRRPPSNDPDELPMTTGPETKENKTPYIPPIDTKTPGPTPRSSSVSGVMGPTYIENISPILPPTEAHVRSPISPVESLPSPVSEWEWNVSEMRESMRSPTLRPKVDDSFTPHRNPPPPPSRNFSLPGASRRHSLLRLSSTNFIPLRSSIQRTNSARMRLKSRISDPVPGTFVHVAGAFINDGEVGDENEHMES